MIRQIIRPKILLILSVFFALLAGFISLNMLNVFDGNYRVRLNSLQNRTELPGMIQKHWLKGDFDNLLGQSKLECSQFPAPEQLDAEFTQCNPEYLDCLLKSKLDEKGFLGFNDENFQIALSANQKVYRPRKLVKINQKVLRAVYEIILKPHEGETIFLYLKDSCRDSYLMENTYATGIYQSNVQDWTWDNKDREIYIDKYPVRRYLYRLWTEENPELVLDDFLFPISNLSTEQMQEYCSLHGGKILESHIFDAGFFFPTKRKEGMINYYRPPFVWQKGEELELLTKETALNDKQSLCKNFYSKECLDLGPFNFKYSGRPSWIGAKQGHGGYLEYLPNKRETNYNLKASSILFGQSSSWHHMGMRASWDEKGFEDKNFSWAGRPPKDIKKFPVTFRCMKEAM